MRSRFPPINAFTRRKVLQQTPANPSVVTEPDQRPTIAMKNHTQLVAILHITMAALSLLGALAVFTFLGLAGGIVVSQGEVEAAGILGIIAVMLGGFLTVLALPGLIGGWALYTERSWGRPVILILGALQLLNIPFGTALGIYTFWALLRTTPDEPPIARAS